MTFENRDRYLITGISSGEISLDSIDRIFSIINKTKEPTKTVLGYVTDIAAVLKEAGLENRYRIFGGYAVLSQLVNRFGDEFIPVWRGSNDIDMDGDMAVLNMIRSAYKVSNDRPSPNLDNKITLKFCVTEEDEEECKTDYRIKSDMPEIEKVPVLGIPISIAKPTDIIIEKIHPAEIEESHLQDIVYMIGILEDRNYNPETLINELSQSQAYRLLKLIGNNKMFEYSEARGINPAPSLPYLRALRSDLKSRAKRR